MYKRLGILVLIIIFSLFPRIAQLAERYPKYDQLLAKIEQIVQDFFYNAQFALNKHSLQRMLKEQAPTLSNEASETIITTLNCVNKKQILHNQILTFIDYSLPANQKRLWVFDLNNKKVLFHTYVAHGLKTGVMASTFFSNQYNSKASSIGLFHTDKPYYGRHGLSLKLDGLEAGFNDHADGRAVVMHGGGM